MRQFCIKNPRCPTSLVAVVAAAAAAAAAAAERGGQHFVKTWMDFCSPATLFVTAKLSLRKPSLFRSPFETHLHPTGAHPPAQPRQKEAFDRIHTGINTCEPEFISSENRTNTAVAARKFKFPAIFFLLKIG